MARIVAIVLAGVVLVSCADRPTVSAPADGPWSPEPGLATEAELTCGPGQPATLSTNTVQAQPDGVHLRVTNAYDETVSVEGFDADPGITDWVFANGPGTMELMCWPFSLHGSGQGPPRIPLEIVDPLGLYVDGSLDCEVLSSEILEFIEEPIDVGPPPLDVAREVIGGLRPDDVLLISGYPEREGGGIIVVRDEEVVAGYGIQRFEEGGWIIAGGNACPGSGLPLPGGDLATGAADV